MTRDAEDELEHDDNNSKDESIYLTEMKGDSEMLRMN